METDPLVKLKQTSSIVAYVLAFGLSTSKLTFRQIICWNRTCKSKDKKHCKQKRFGE
jgi:hypothetical protein